MAKPNKKSDFVERMESLLGSEAPAFFESLAKLVSDRGELRSLRLNSLRGLDVISEANLREWGAKILGPVPWFAERGRFFRSTSPAELASHPASGAALFYTQEAGAMEAVAMLAPKPGEVILDLCAAPGGKSTQILEELQGRGWLVSNEAVPKRAERLDALIARHGALNVSVYSLDPASVVARFGPVFDKVLVDAPCSGESLYAKRQDLRTDIRDVDVKGCARRQFTILSNAADLVRMGGTLVYSTCTYSREENEDMTRAFLAAFPSYQLVEERRRWPHIDGVPGGYVAKFLHSSSSSSDFISASVVGVPELPPPASVSFASWSESKGLLRHSVLRWNQELDLYAIAQSFKNPEEQVKEHPHHKMQDVLLEKLKAGASLENYVLESQNGTQGSKSDTDLAKLFLRGEALIDLQGTRRGYQKILWKGHPLGVAKAVEGRLNNLLPRILRSSLEF